MQKQIEQTLTSLEVAEMINKNHADLMRDIRRYTKQLNQSKIAFVDFFQESIYIDGKGEERPCYKITKKGCEFVAHKLTGIKGTEFTGKYINRFHDMEEILEGIAEQETEQKQKAISLKEQLEAVAFVAEDLHVPQSNKIMMFRKVCENNHINSNFLPAYSEREDREAKPATELLEKFQCGISARKFNEWMIEAGYLEERERTSSSSKTGKKKFKALTDKGLRYGKNLTCEKNTKETQPYYYVDTFLELYHLVMQEVA